MFPGFSAFSSTECFVILNTVGEDRDRIQLGRIEAKLNWGGSRPNSIGEDRGQILLGSIEIEDRDKIQLGRIETEEEGVHARVFTINAEF